MKRVITLLLVLSMLFSCMAIAVGAMVSDTLPFPAVTETKEDFVITPDDTNGATVEAYYKTDLKETVFENRLSYLLDTPEDGTGTHASITVSNLKIKASDYNYILINCYYTGETYLRPGYVGLSKGDARPTDGWYALWPHVETSQTLTMDTRYGSGNIKKGQWMTVVVPILSVDVYTSNQLNAEGTIEEINILMHGNNGDDAVKDPVYISSIVFSQDTSCDMPASTPVAVCGAQTTTPVNNAYNLRFVGTLNKDLVIDEYSKVGFYVSAKSTSSAVPKVGRAEDGTVYTSVTGGGEVYHATKYGASYLSVLEIENLPADEDITFEIVPYLVKRDGIKVYGTSAVMRFNCGEYVSGYYFYGGPTDTTADGYQNASADTLQALDDQAFAMKVELKSVKQDWSNSAIVYYISNTGSNQNSGRSQDAPRADLSGLTLKYGDVVLFERGGTWRTTLKAVSGVTYSNYGDMNKPLPVISGSAKNYADESLWTQCSENVWRLEGTLDNVGIMAFDHSGNIGEYDQLVGKKLFVADTTSNWSDLNEDLEFYSDPDSKELYLYSASNPGKRFSSIEIGTNQHLFTIGSAENVTVDGLHFTYTGGHGIGGAQVGCQDITVRNCVLDWIGGSRMNANALYGNAIEIYGSASNVTIENNWCYQIFDTGITFQASNAQAAAFNNITIKNNLVEYCHWAIEAYNQNASGTTQNVSIDGNFCRFSGMGWGSRYRVEQNGADKAQNAGASLFCSWGFGTAPVNFTVTNNTFDRCTGYLGLVQLLDGDESIVFSGNTYIQIEGEQLGKLFRTYPKMSGAEEAMAVIRGETLGDMTGVAVFVSTELQNTETVVTLPTQRAEDLTSKTGYFTGTTEKDVLQYQTGDDIVFNISLRNNGTIISCNTIRWEAHTDDGHSYYGEATGKTGTIRIVIPATGTGFVRLRCYAVDKGGNLIANVKQSTDVNAENMFGAGINIGEISQKWEEGNTEPTDFDKYWNEQLAALDNVAPDMLKMELDPRSETHTTHNIYRAKINCSGIGAGDFVTGYITVPKTATEKSLQLKLYYYGYGTDDERKSATPFCEAGAITFMVFAHSMELGQDKSVYEAELKDYGFSGNESPDTSYFRGMILRDVQAVRFCMKYFGTEGVNDATGNKVDGLNLWDGKNVNVSGGSQGGFQAIAVTALVPKVNSAYYEVPWMCDVASSTSPYAPMQSVFRPEYVSGLAYFDSVSFAKRIKRENVNFVILRAGLGDYVCPPSGIMALYDALDCVVNFRFTQGKTHGTTLPTTDSIVLDTQMNK